MAYSDERPDQSHLVKNTIVSQAARTETSKATFAQPKKSYSARFKEFINKKINVTRQELLATQDVNIVTQKRMRIYAYSNLIFFVLQLSLFALVQWWNALGALTIFQVASIDPNNNKNLPLVPLQMEPSVETASWIGVFLLQAIFVLRGLPCV